MLINSQMKKYWLLIVISTLSACAAVSTETINANRKILEQEQDRQEIKALQTRYMQFWDQMLNRESGRPDARFVVENIFSEDGSWVVIDNNKQKTIFHGRSLVEYIQSLDKKYADSSSHYVKHFSLNPQIDVVGESATKREQFLVLHTDRDRKESYWLIGYYDDVLTKNPEGHWRFKSKTIYLEDITLWSSERK